MLIRSRATRLLASGPRPLSLSTCRLSNPAAAAAAAVAARRVVTTVSDSRSQRRKSFRALDGFERNLATVADSVRRDDYMPFDSMHMELSGQNQFNNPNDPPLYKLRPFNVSQPVTPVLTPTIKTTSSKIRTSFAGIPGDMEEMLSVFEACLHVGRLDRAALVLVRLSKVEELDKERLMILHHRYLSARISQLETEPDPDIADAVHKWFELNIRDAGLPITPTTIAYMLKASLLTCEGAVLESRITRYMSMLPDLADDEGLDMGDVLTDQDLATIADICPSYYVSEELGMPAELEADDQEVEDAELIAKAHEEREYTKLLHDVPEVLETPQKGLGLKSLKSTLSMFDSIPDGLDIATLPRAQRLEVQAKLERDSVDAAIARWREENEQLMKMGLSSQIGNPSLSSKLYSWHQALEARIREEQAKVVQSDSATKKNAEDLDRCLWGIHLLQSPPHRLAAVTILSVLSNLGMHGAETGVPVSNMVQSISKIAEEDIRALMVAKNLPKSKMKKKRQQTVRQLLRRNAKAAAAAAAATGVNAEAQAAVDATTDTTNSNESVKVDPLATERSYGSLEARWPMSIRVKLGATLLASLMETATIVVERKDPNTGEVLRQVQPAFVHATQFKRGRKLGVILPNKALTDLLKREPRGETLARHLPMVTEPRPWTKFDKGGFLVTPTALVRLKNHERDQRLYAEAAIERGDMEQTMRALDVLGKTAWRINRPVFDVMLEAWNTGEEFANIPPLNPDLPLPPEPDSIDDPMKKRLWLQSVKAIENEKSGMHSVRCFMNFQLEIARAFRDQTFYFPHNVDFRGRAYPMPTYLNHMGADHVRGLLKFAKGRPLGERGLMWLKVHLANVYGFDKASLQEREEFANKNMDNIFDSAENPLKGKRWWLEAEDPWQCLATCFELKAALSSPNPHEFVSHLPVHQDGTCNGLQHYAALGGDMWGAQQVNLLPGDRPADVYAAVADLVKESIAKDKEDGHEYAIVLDGKITRKVVKQTVMTNVYGVTFAGAKKQVQKQLDDLYPDLYKEHGIPVNFLSSYIASKIFVALGSMFEGAHDIQHWLGEIGGRVCRAMTPEQLDRLAAELENSDDKKKKVKSKTDEEVQNHYRSTLVWTTPLRMPVVQPYRKNSTKLISTCLQDLSLTVADRDDPVNRRKQLQAFPPNFIHSLDASHMMLSALECDALGLTFAAVHDSFWTHAADVDKMNVVLRDAFIRIHQEDVIGRLKSEFEARYRGAIYRARVLANTPVGERIMQLRKEHPRGVIEELLIEHKRQKLLASSDPAKRKEGQKMVTPASIFEEFGKKSDVQNVVQPEDLEEAGDEDGSAAVADAGEGETAAAAAPKRRTTKKKAKAGPTFDHPLPLTPDSGDDVMPASRRVNPEHEAEAYTNAIKELSTKNFFSNHLNRAERVQERMGRSKSATLGTIELWLPLTFPDIPKKGEFDVRMLRESQYFFS